MSFLLILILNQWTHIADELTLLQLRRSWSAISFTIHYSFYLISAVFSPLHDKHCETNDNVSNKIDESNTLFYHIVHRLVWWDGLHEFILFFLVFFYRKLHLNFLLFVNYCLIKLRYFWWNYFLNKIKWNEMKSFFFQHKQCTIYNTTTR